MIIRPRRDTHLVIGKYTGKIIIGVGLLMLVPLATSAVFAEWDTVADFALSCVACLVFGLGLQLLCRTDRELGWGDGLVVAAGSWVWATLLGALPYYLSGHEAGFLDAMFDAMSGYTTTGLYLLQDLDHVSVGLNMWRHLITYVGGQGIVVIALTFLFKGSAGAYTVYVGEGKEDRLLPNVVNTARAIWLVSLVYLVVGTVVLWVTSITALGQEPVQGGLHSLWVFMGGWSTGGFAPTSYNTMYYHSFAYEIVTMVIFVVGSFNFALHWAVWTGRRREILRNVETVSFTVTLTLLVMMATFWLAKAGVYPDALALGRKAFYQVASAHTTTGYSTIYSKAFVSQWGIVATLAATFAMAIGASACSTGGGIKGIRVGLVTKSFVRDVRRLIAPESAVIGERIHHIRSIRVDDTMLRSAMTIAIAYVLTYVTVATVGALCGYDFAQALFEGVSAASNTGLSCGVTDPSMPWVMKAVYIFVMWLGRLEFMAVLAVGGYAFAVLRGQ